MNLDQPDGRVAVLQRHRPLPAVHTRRPLLGRHQARRTVGAVAQAGQDTAPGVAGAGLDLGHLDAAALEPGQVRVGADPGCRGQDAGDEAT